MRASIIFTTLFAAFVAAAPAPLEASTADIEARQALVTRVVFADDTVDTAVQAEVPRNGRAIAIKGTFGLGNNVRTTRAGIVGDRDGTCQIFKDAGRRQLVATIRGRAGDVNFPIVELGNGVIVCV